MATGRRTRNTDVIEDVVSDESVASAAVPEPAGARMGDMAPFIWQQLADIQKALGGIEANQAAVRERLERVEDKTSKLSDRIGRLMWGVAGAGILVTLLFGVARLFPIKIAFEEHPRTELSVPPKAEPSPPALTK